MQIQMPTGVGAVIAILVLVADVALSVVGHPPGGEIVALGLGALAVARLT